MERERVPIDQLVDLSKAGRGGAPPTRSDLRRALPKGWVLDDDGLHAIRDRRLLFGQGWILLTAMIVFGALSIAIFASAAPRGWSALIRVGILIVVLVLIGGVIGPLITRALHKR
jgi:hypothetical protein